MKLLSGLFLLYMTTKCYTLLTLPDELPEEARNSNSVAREDEPINKPYVSLLYAFSLGALISFKRIVKLGIW